MAPHTVLVTGASSGIGYQLALRLARNGHAVLALARDKSRLEELSRLDAGIRPIVFDLGRTADIAEFAAGLCRQFPDLGLLVNNAAVQRDVRLERQEHADIEAEIALDLTAPILLTRALLAPIVAKGGMIVNVVSALALAPKSTSAVYSASKAGLLNFSAGLRNQLADTDVAVCDVFPPVVDTPMTAGRDIAKASAEEVAGAIAAGIAARRESIWIGKTRILPILMRISPGLVGRIMRNS